MRRIPALFLALLCPALAWAAPAELLAQVHADLRAVPEPDRCTTRYLVSPVEPRADDEFLTWYVVAGGHFNGVSRTARLRPVYAVRVGGTLTRLFRANLADYGVDPQTWEKLGEAEPYFHYQEQGQGQERVETKYVDKWFTANGRQWPPGNYQYKVRDAGRLPTAWLNSADAENIRRFQDIETWTQSKTPMVWADWFINQTATADGRTVTYYNLAGFKDEKEFQKRVRFDKAFGEGLEHIRSFPFSGISLGPRELERRRGGYWLTRDNRHDGRQQDADDPTVTLGGKVKFLASRGFAPLPNGLPLWILNDKDGNLQAKAPDDIIGCDRNGKGNDGRVHINVTCWRCHNMSAKEENVKDWKALKLTKLRADSPEELRRLEDQYQRERKMLLELKQDREVYRDAVSEMTGGWTCQKYGQAYAGAWESYELAKVDLAWAANRLLYPADDVRAALRATERAEALHPVLGLLLQDGEDGKVTVRQFERVYSQAQQIMVAWEGTKKGANR